MNAPDEAVRDGKYICYAYEMHGIRMGIMRYDTKRKAKKQIVSYLRNRQSTKASTTLQ